MKRQAILIFAATLAGSSALVAQTANPMSTEVKQAYTGIKNNLVKMAEKMPDENYSFKPTPEIRSLGGVIGHIADGNNLLCSMANGDKPVFNQANEKKTTRAELVAALKASFAACDKVFDATTDANASTPVDLFGQKQTRLGVLAFNNSHMWEHYGNLVTYMRLKNIVPPSSEK